MSTPGQKLRVAHIITQLELGGAQQNTLYTVAHLDRERYEPSLICGKRGLLDAEAKKGVWPTHFVRWLVRPLRPWNDFLALVALYQLLRKHKPQLVHTHSSKAGILGRITEVRYGRKELDASVVPGLLLDAKKFVESTSTDARPERDGK